MKYSYWNVEQTDLFGGERNYSWVKRWIVRATTPNSAMAKIAMAELGGGWRKHSSIGDFIYYRRAYELTEVSIIWREDPPNDDDDDDNIIR